MKRKLKRIITLGLAVSMVITALWGCGEKDEGKDNSNSTTADTQSVSSADSQGSETSETGVKKEGYPISDEKMSLRVLSIPDSVTDASECDIHNEIAEVTNADIEWELIPSTSWEEKKSLVLARTELPEIILANMPFTDAEYLNMIGAGQLIAIDEYLDYAPNFRTVLENSPGLREAITAEDGHIYAFPYFYGTGETYDCMTNQVSYINQKWLDTLGLKMPTTTEELKEVLVAFKEKDPNGNGIADEIPLTVNGANGFDDWFGAFGIIPSANEINVKNLTVMDGEVVYAPSRDEYRAALDYFHELWELGVLDPETFTQDGSMLSAKQKSETRIAGMFEAWRGTAWRLSDEDDEYAILPALTGPDGDCLYPQRYSGINSRAGSVITKDCENIELAVRWIDTLIDPLYSYQMLTDHRLGYHDVDNGGETYEVLTPYDENDPVQDNMVDLRYICVDWTTMAKQPRPDDPFNVNVEKAVSDAIYKPCYPQEHYPNVFLTLEESATVGDVIADLQMYMDQFYADWIVNGGDDAKWESHLKQLESLGMETFVEVYTGALDRYNAS